MNEKSKILIVGNHTCANRGDAAILRGTLKLLRQEFPEVDADFVTRFPKASRIVLGEEGEADHLYLARQAALHSGRKLNAKYAKYWPWLLHYAIYIPFLRSLLPKHYKDAISSLSNYDLVIQVGGSFLIDLYGIHQFEHILLSRLAGVRILLLGHSIGPFERKGFKRLARSHLSQVDSIILREDESLSLYKSIAQNISNVKLAGDAAWLLKDFNSSRPIPTEKVVAFTARDLGPFAKRLGVTQDQYELLLARFLDRVAGQGFRILGMATCTPLDGYDKDDRVVASRVIDRMAMKHLASIIDKNDQSDEEFMDTVQGCSLIIGTRLHSCIMAMSRGVPALAILYEHKSLGVLKRLGLSYMSVKIQDLGLEKTWNSAEDALSGRLTQRMKDSVEAEFNTTWKEYASEIRRLL